MFSYLEDRYNDGERYVLHYVTAREVHNIIKAAEAGHGVDPNDYRDFILPPPRLSFPGQRRRPCPPTPTSRCSPCSCLSTPLLISSSVPCLLFFLFFFFF